MCFLSRTEPTAVATPAVASVLERVDGKLMTGRPYAHPDPTKSAHMVIKASIAEVMVQRQKKAQAIVLRPRGPQRRGNAKLGRNYWPEVGHPRVRITMTKDRTVAYRTSAEADMGVVVTVAEKA